MTDRFKGHAFVANNQCQRCGMTRKEWDNKGQPDCIGKMPPAPKPQQVADDG
jgi:hypothetical protein